MWRTWTFSLAAALAVAAAPAAAHPARGIVAKPDGTVVFSDLERVWSIDPRGRLRPVLEHPGEHTHALALDPSGAVVGETSRYDSRDGSYSESLWRTGGDGRVRLLLGSAKATRGIGLLSDARGCRYHADQTGRGAGAEAGRPLVHRKCPGKAAERLVGSAADDRAFRPALVNDVAGVAWGPGGALWFRQGGAVRVIDSQGRVRVAASRLSADNYGIAVDRAGKLYVAEAAQRRILAVAPDGRRTVAARSEAPWFPTGVALGGAALYLLEATDFRRGQPLRMRVRRVVAGRAAVLARVTVPD